MDALERADEVVAVAVVRLGGVDRVETDPLRQTELIGGTSRTLDRGLVQIESVDGDALVRAGDRDRGPSSPAPHVGYAPALDQALVDVRQPLRDPRPHERQIRGAVAVLLGFAHVRPEVPPVHPAAPPRYAAASAGNCCAAATDIRM